MKISEQPETEDLPPPRKNEAEQSIGEAINAYAERQKVRNDTYDKRNRKDTFKALFYVAVIVLLFAIATFTGSAWWIFREQLHEAERAYEPITEAAAAAKVSADAARASAEAATAAVELSDEIAERRLRAYVDLSDIAINVIAVPGGNDAQLVGVLVIKNFGATPSNNVEISARTIFRKYPLGSTSLPERSKNQIVTARFAPGQEQRSMFPWRKSAITAEQRASWEKEAIAAYFYGTVKYDDVFERTCTIYFKVLKSKTDGDISRFAVDGNNVQCFKPPSPQKLP